MVETIQGMAEAIEQRRRDLNLTVGELAAAAGITAQALAGYRRGERRDSVAAERTKRGLASALGWPADWYERLDAGEDPASFPVVDAADSVDVVGIAALAGELTPEDRAKVEGYIRGLLDGKNG